MRILIADDEISIIQLIKKLIDPGTACEIVGEATDGNRTLSLIEDCRPDIVITDIRMPGLNGIEMIREARERGLNTEFIIISGYKDFQYAQNAIRYGAAAYLLKPIKTEELNGAIRQICQKQCETESLKLRIADMEHTIAQNRRMKRRESLACYIDWLYEPVREPFGNIAPGFCENFQVQPGIFAVLILKLDFEESVEEEFVVRNLEVLGDKYHRALMEICYDLESFCRGSRCYILFHMEKGQWQEAVRILELLMEDRLFQYPMYQVGVALGAAVDSPSRLGEAFLTADYALAWRLRQGYERLLVYPYPSWSEGKLKLPVKPYLTEGVRQRLDRVLYEEDQEAFEGVYWKLCQEMENSSGADPYVIKGFLESIACYVVIWLRRQEGQDSSREEENIRCNIAEKTDSCCSVEGLYGLCLRFCVEQIEAAGQRRKEGISRPIKLMKTYIRDHLGENPSLDEIAGAAELSGAYGSSIFKKETGMTITSYLIQIRMEEAQRLIRETNMTINEIAYRVGYSDARHFSKLFIKTVGIKPVDYRRFYN